MSATARPGESPTPDPTASQTSLTDNLSVRSSESPQGSRTDVRRISFARDRSGSRRRSNHSSPAGDLDNQIGSLPEVAKTSSNSGTGRRISSPPPPSTYQRGVSFDTFDNRDASDFSFTLNYKHKNFQATRQSRTFLCGTDQNDYSDFALEWLIDELVDDGDEIVCLRVVEKDSKIASDASVEEGRYRKEAEKLLDSVIHKNRHDEKAISLVLELAVGKVQEIIQRMIRIYEPAILIVGTRGRSLSGMQGLLPGSVSKYCLQQSPIPVVVVRPTAKREKKKRKRLADPTRRSYNNILQLSEKTGSGFFDTHVKFDAYETDKSIPVEEERAAVAEAVGLPRRFRELEQRMERERENELKQTLSKESGTSSRSGGGDESVGTEAKPRGVSGLREVDAENVVVMKSPLAAGYDTPSSESEDNSDNEGHPHRSPNSDKGENQPPDSPQPLNNQFDRPPLESQDSVDDQVSPRTTPGVLSPSAVERSSPLAEAGARAAGSPKAHESRE